MMDNTITFAFVGFRHPHGWAIWNRLQREPRCEIVAVCEEDEQTRCELRKRDDMAHIYDDCAHMLADTSPDVVATADYYGNRGRILVAALERGLDVLADKPICTTLSQVNRIARLVTEHTSVVGCELDLRAVPQFHQARELVRNGEIGDIHAINFGGQHPHHCYRRADWYFDRERYGGVINDIAVHGIDILQWITGLPFTEVVAARNWSALKLAQMPFRDAAQLMLTMENGCGVLGDVSFITPSSCGFSLPYYWELTFWGSKGVLRVGLKHPAVELAREGKDTLEVIPKRQDPVPDYFEHFMAERDGRPGDLDTAAILDASRKALLCQKAADEGLTGLALP